MSLQRAFSRNEPNPWLLADLDPGDTRPPAIQIAASIRDAISEGVFRPGDLLPGGSHIARRYGTSEATAGRALKALFDEGLVRSHVGRGSYVAGAPS